MDAQGGLRIHEGITRPSPDRKPPGPEALNKFRLLRELLWEELISSEDYTERARKIRRKAAR